MNYSLQHLERIQDQITYKEATLDTLNWGDVYRKSSYKITFPYILHPIILRKIRSKLWPQVRSNPLYDHLQDDDDDADVVYRSQTVMRINQQNEPKEEYQYHPTPEKLKQRKNRHRRSGSHGSQFISVKCEKETQTEIMFELTSEDPATDSRSLIGCSLSPKLSSSSLKPSRHSLPLSVNSSHGSTLAPVLCKCQGCPGNPFTLDLRLDDENSNNIGDAGDQEDYLDTLDRKVTEIINRDSRRSSQHDLVIKDDDIYGSMSLTYSRTRLGSDLNSNPRYSLPPAPEGTIMFEDDGKESSSDEMNTSREDLTCVWSEDDQNGNNDQSLFTRRQTRDPTPRHMGHVVPGSSPSTRPMSIVSSEEGEVTEYPDTTGHISTLESNPDLMGLKPSKFATRTEV